jgi:hypothetical protein
MRPTNPSMQSRHGVNGKAAEAVCIALAAVLLAALVVTAALGQPGPAPAEYDVKAAYLFNFGKFLRLEGDATPPRRSTFDICILGHDPIGHVLDDIVANQSIDGRPVRVVRVGDANLTRGCDILFVSPDEGDGIPLDLDAIAKADVLTVSDAPDFLQYGGMIQFVMEDGRVRFAVNLDAVCRTHLVLSSELLRVASSVTGRPPPEEQP